MFLATIDIGDEHTMTSVTLNQVSVEFPVFSASSRSLRAALTGHLGGRLTRQKNNLVSVRALHELTLTLEQGDRVGLVGPNGAGKTTLLRVIAGVYPPVRGSVAVQGRVVAFTDLTLGMDLEAPGWDNIVYRGVQLGLTFREARELAPSIAEFTELNEYLDVPVRTYSQGMLLRLAFAISTAIHPDVLVMDEIIGAGDPQFAVRAAARMNELMQRSKILIMASHASDILQSYCNKALWLEHGQMRAFGPIGEVLQMYAQARREADPARV